MLTHAMVITGKTGITGHAGRTRMSDEIARHEVPRARRMLMKTAPRVHSVALPERHGS